MKKKEKYSEFTNSLFKPDLTALDSKVNVIQHDNTSVMHAC